MDSYFHRYYLFEFLNTNINLFSIQIYCPYNLQLLFSVFTSQTADYYHSMIICYNDLLLLGL